MKLPRARSLLALPRLQWHDVVAGVSVAVVLVPQSLAYAELSGVPAHRGLFAAALPVLVAAAFASSPYLQPGPTAITALLTFGALSPLAPVGSARFVELALLLALMVGAIRVAVGLLGAGTLAYLLSQPVIAGFVPAAAILIGASQLPVVLGVAPEGGNALANATSTLLQAGEWRAEAIVAAAAAAAILLLSPRLHVLFPGVLLATAGAICWARYAGYGGETVGPVPASLPPLTTSLPLSAAPQLLVPAFVIALLGFAEATSIARTYAALDRRRWDANREFVSQGAANLAAGAFGGFPVGASFSRSALNRQAGARTAASVLVTGAAVLAFLPFAFLLEPLPLAVLGAIVIVAVVPLVAVRRLVELSRLSRVQTGIALATFALTLALAPHVEWAIIAAIVFSVVNHLWRELRLDVFTRSVGDRLELRPHGVLWFGSARILEDRFLALLACHRDARQLVIRLDALGRIDLTGALAVKALVADARLAGLDAVVEGAPPHAIALLRRVLAEDVGSSDHGQETLARMES